MYVENPVLVRATVVFGQDVVVQDYTAKLVKTLLIAGNPKLGEVFSSIRGPKPLHITPLYTYRQGSASSVKAVYSRHVSTGSTARPLSVERIKPVRLEAGREYFFYVGTSSSLLGDVLHGLSNVDGFAFGRGAVAVERLRYEVEYVDVEREAERVRGLLESVSGGRVKVVFESPTLLKDPLAVARARKRKLFMPLPEAVLSTPVYMLLLDTGRFRSSLFRRLMVYVKSVLDTPYTALKTVNLVWYIYDNKPLPAIIGYVKYYVDADTLQRVKVVAELKYCIDFINTLTKAFVLARMLS